MVSVAMEDRVGARSGRFIARQGLRSVQDKTNERSRQRDLSVNPWSATGKKNPSNQKATNIENLLRYALLRKGVNYIEQASIGPWSVDFLLPDYMVCVEADGEFWHSSTSAIMKDRRKDAWLRSKGYLVFHFDGKEIIQDPDFCVARMMKSINAHMEKLIKAIEAEVKEETDGTEKPDAETPRDIARDDDYERWISTSA